MIPIKNKKKSLEVTIEEMRAFAFNYIEKFAPSKQQLKTYLLKKYLRSTGNNLKKSNVSDLIDIVLKTVHQSNSKHHLNLYADSENKNSTPTGKDLVNKTLFVLGNITWNDFTSNGKKTISLDRVPISMKLFMEFWIEKVVKRQRKSYPLNQFIKDVMTNLVKAVFTNKCRIHGEPLNNLTCNLEHVSVNPDISGDPKINLIPSMAIGDVDEGLFNALSPISSPTRILLKTIIFDTFWPNF